MTDTITTTETIVPVKSAWASKINWLQIGGVVLGAATAILGGNMIGLTPEQTAKAVAVINFLQGAITVVMRTFYSPSVVKNSL